MKSLTHFLTFAAGVSALSLPSESFWKHAASPEVDAAAGLKPRQSTSCANSATSRDCWGDYSIDTNYYVSVPHEYQDFFSPGMRTRLGDDQSDMSGWGTRIHGEPRLSLIFHLIHLCPIT